MSLGVEMRKCTNILGLHAHVGTFNLDDSIRLINASQDFLQNLSFYNKTTRNQVYDLLVRNITGESSIPPTFDSREDYLEKANLFGDNPDDVYYLLRPTKYGTVEFRCNDATDDFLLVRNVLVDVRDHVAKVLLSI